MSSYRENIQHLLYHLKTWNMWQTLQQLTQIDFDVVFFDFIFSTIYHDLFCDRLTILNEHNIESKLLQRCANADSAAIITNLAREVDAAKPFLNAEPQAKLLAEYEHRTWRKFHLRCVVSQADRQELDSYCSTGKTLVVKNGIDTKTILPVDNSNSSKILFMGTLKRFFPNLENN